VGALGDDLQVGRRGDRGEVGALHQQAAADALVVGLLDGAQGTISTRTFCLALRSSRASSV
jgi:hypothetical protein